ncbi:MAG: DUF1826 domain-containing protein [Paracoccaceae bacterium]|nr:DUF1826 domain-containing protein [Paracoccaceae bacterium]
MNIVAKPVEDTPIGVSFADDPASLSTFLQPASAAVVWRRHIPADMQAWLDGLDPGVLPCGRIVVPSDVVGDTVAHLFEESGLPKGTERDWLHQDIVSLANTFSALIQAKFLRVRLAAVTTNACRKFHIDAITARLVCTYRGMGTQYGTSHDGHDPSRVFTVPTGSPILLRGTLWPAEPPAGLLHRSPPIEGTGETRLVLVLDPVFDPEEEA